MLRVRHLVIIISTNGQFPCQIPLFRLSCGGSRLHRISYIIWSIMVYDFKIKLLAGLLKLSALILLSYIGTSNVY